MYRDTKHTWRGDPSPWNRFPKFHVALPPLPPDYPLDSGWMEVCRVLNRLGLAAPGYPATWQELGYFVAGLESAGVKLPSTQEWCRLRTYAAQHP